MKTDEYKMQIKRILAISKNRKMIKGIHFEGPFISSKYCGAISKLYLKNPDVEYFKNLISNIDGLKVCVTISPELDGAIEFIKAMKECGVLVNLGHSEATYEKTMQAISCGANGFTHIFNAMRQLHHREVGILGAALLSDAYVEAIVDGKHLSRETIRILKKMKEKDKIVLITDSIMATGMQSGEYYLKDTKIFLEGGEAFLSDLKTRAGSLLSADAAVYNFAEQAGISFNDAVLAMTKNPARRAEIFNVTGSLEEGKYAEFFLVD